MALSNFLYLVLVFASGVFTVVALVMAIREMMKK